MIEPVQREQILGKELLGICHSQYSQPEFVLEGIGPATFRSHFLSLSNGLILDLFTAEITCGSIPPDSMPGESSGLPMNELIGRRVAAVLRDDVYRTAVVLEGGIFLVHGNDGAYGNPLITGYLDRYSEFTNSYARGGNEYFTDYWTDEVVAHAQLERLCSR